MRRLSVALLWASVGLLAGCATSGPTAPAPDRTPYPAPSGATPLSLAVAGPPSPDLNGAVAGCGQALVGPVQIVLVGTTVSFVSTATGSPVLLIWPPGFAAWLVEGRAEVVAPDGKVIGRSGDVTPSLGGPRFAAVNSGPAFGVCSVGQQSYP
ncbi:MAG TPA: hypothetical protein VKR24_03900 [Candidatus Limnocylindrales bacterium]|nr:hypothetical protein [Candidatus Limnocylindrales bacterium]